MAQGKEGIALCPVRLSGRRFWFDPPTLFLLPQSQ